MISLTAPDNSEVLVNPDVVISVFPNEGTFHKDAKTVLSLPNGHQAVKEDLDTVKKLLWN